MSSGNGMVGVGLVTSGFRVWQSPHVAVLFRFRSFSAFTMLGENHRHTVLGPKINWQTLRRPIVCWDALYRARAGKNRHVVADLEDAVFGLYLPMARTLAHTVVGESVDRHVSEQSAELGLAHAVLAGGTGAAIGVARFRIVQQLQEIDLPRSRAKGHALLQLGTDPAGSMSSSP